MYYSVREKIINELDKLSQEQQKKILDYVLKLKISKKKTIKGKDLINFSGTIRKEDLVAMKKAIVDGCEKVDINEW